VTRSLLAARVESYLRSRCFASASPVHDARLRFGAEMELLAVKAASRRVALIGDAGTKGTLDVARAAGARLGWTECQSAKGVPRFVSPTGGALCFEPGGQLEYASAVHHSIDALRSELLGVERTLRDEATTRDIELLAQGIDPDNDIADVPLQLTAHRYRRMAAYFAGIGAHGARMMRQTASLQLCVGGVDVRSSFQLANALAPWLTALFANSARYAGRNTGCASYRAETWRGVDPTRTGVLQGDDPVREYAAFALAAPAFLVSAESAAPLPLSMLDDDSVPDDALATHLSTLFPEVRPRGYLELRSLDAVDSAHHAAAMVFVSGLLAEPSAAAEAREVTGAPDVALLILSGRRGLADARILAGARDLVAIAIAGCTRLGEGVVSSAVLEQAREALHALLLHADRSEHALAEH
jgi:glutamate--cysteine ligase